MGAVSGFAAAQLTGNPWIGMMAAIVCGPCFRCFFGVLALTLVANQVATGLALTLLGLGLSGLIGESFVGQAGIKLPSLYIPGLSDIPLVGKLLFGGDPIFYLSIVLTLGVIWFLFRTRAGLTLRAVGRQPYFSSCSRDQGYRYSLSCSHVWRCLCRACRCAPVAGLYAAMGGKHDGRARLDRAGSGGVCIMASTAAGCRAYLFGAVGILQLHAQAMGFGIPSQLLSAMPYLATVIVLVLISGNRRLTMMNTPASLGRAFVPDR